MCVSHLGSESYNTAGESEGIVESERWRRREGVGTELGRREGNKEVGGEIER